MYIFLCKNRNRYLLILDEFHGQTTVIFEKIGHFARFWLGNSFGASFPVICPWKTIKIDRNMKNKRAYPFISQYFNFYFFLLFLHLSQLNKDDTQWRAWLTSHQIKRNQEFLCPVFASFHLFLTYCSILEKTRRTWGSQDVV